MITSELLAKIFPTTSAAKRDRFLTALNKFLPLYGITTYRRACAFLATGGIETDYLKTTVEYASGADYEGRRDLGNTQEGDGRRFKGRGFFQTTGRFNYNRVNQTLGKKLGIKFNFLKNPELLAEIDVAVESACVFWLENHLDKYADKGDFKNVNSIVNTGQPGRTPNQWAKRNELYSLCLRRVPKDFSFATEAEPVTSQNYDDPARLVKPDERQTTPSAQNSASIKELGSTVFMHCPKDSVKNIFVVIGTRVLTGVLTVWGLGLHGQIFLIVGGLIFAAVIGYAVWKYSDRAIIGAKKILDYLWN